MSTYAIPYTNFGAKNAGIREELITAFAGVLDGGRYIMGPEVDAFQREFAAYCGSKFGVGVSTGLDALHLVLRVLGIGEGHEVITVSNSFIATAASIALIGARPVFVDITPDFNIDPAKIEAAITPRTRAIIPVHLTGRPARMKEVLAVARAHNLAVVEDAAQAVGAKLDGKRVGSWGDAACFSLHPLKNLHAIGDGGAVTTDRPEIAEQVAKVRNHGLANRERCDFWGFNCRLDELQAALLRVQLRQLDRWTDERRRLAFRYNELLRPFVEVPEEREGEYCVYQTYVVAAERRDALQRHLKSNGVEALVHYPVPIHLQPAAKELGYSADDFPVTSRVTARILSLPLYPGLTNEQQDRVAELFADFYQGQSPR
jgi:dTDP-4-amino-4,6-dideoxygalactose transaminase